MPSIGEYLNKLWYIHYLEYNSARKKNKLFHLCCVKKKTTLRGQIPYDFIYIIVPKFQSYVEENRLAITIVWEYGVVEVGLPVEA